MTAEDLLQAKLHRIDQSHRIIAGKTALLVIDMQQIAQAKDFFSASFNQKE